MSALLPSRAHAMRSAPADATSSLGNGALRNCAYVNGGACPCVSAGRPAEATVSTSDSVAARNRRSGIVGPDERVVDAMKYDQDTRLHHHPDAPS